MKLFKSLIVILMMLAIIVYAMTRLILVVISSSDYLPIEMAFAWLLLLSEFFILIHSFGYARELLRISFSKVTDFKSLHKLPDTLPEVAILVAARHEPREVLEKTFRSITSMRYPAMTVYLLDDSSEEGFKMEAEQITKEFGLNLFRRENRHGAKAGIINDCLKTLTQKYVCVFDADQNPKPGFLFEIIQIIEADKKVAFIQTPQFYTNTESNRVAKAASYQQSVFYEYICESKGSSESMFCCGTNVIFRRDALVGAGGFDESVVTEDFATSIKIHMNGWKSLYYPHVGVFGMGPEGLEAYFKQQSRWAKGTIGVFRKLIFNLFTHPFKLSFSQWWEYFLSSTYYFFGAVFAILMICPIVYTFFNVPSFFYNADLYLSIFLPYFGLAMGIFLISLRMRHYSLKQLLLGQILAYITFPVYIRSAIEGLLGIQGAFKITAKGKTKKLSFFSMWPQMFFLYVNFAAVIWGLNRVYFERDMLMTVNCFWTFYHFLIMTGIFYFNEGVSKADKS